MNSAFIQTNRKQLLGAKIAKYALEERGGLAALGIPVTIIEVEDVPAFQALIGKPFRVGYAPYSFDDLQSFTLTRFMPPGLMGYEGRALVIDPDVFALKNIAPLFEMDLQGHALAACPKKDYFDSSVMILDCPKLCHWKIAKLLGELAQRERDYDETVRLIREDVLPLPREWNSLDALTPNAKMLHTTSRLTQPWKTGLPIDFTRHRLPKIFGVIPREPLHKLFGKYPRAYQPHPDRRIDDFFFVLAREAGEAGAFTDEFIRQEINAGNVRPDFLSLLSR